mmetsp:Transcript_20544/g.31267  ORF Transcript_20544/g.31267 Transcript_20544/m.31267 type:complete len:134 (+) Transcript_20544:1750-2151(+)
MTALDMGGALSVEEGCLKWNLKFKSQQRQVVFSKIKRAELNPEESKEGIIFAKVTPEESPATFLPISDDPTERKREPGSPCKTSREESKHEGRLEPYLEKRRSSLRLSTTRSLAASEEGNVAQMIDFLFNPQP